MARQKTGFLLIDCSISILIMGLMIGLYNHWHAHCILHLYQSKLRIEGLFLARNSIERMRAGIDEKEPPSNHFQLSVSKKIEGQFCWLTASAIPHEQEPILPISLTVGYSLHEGSV